MTNTNIDTSELEYLKSCRDKLRDINEIAQEEKVKEKNQETSAEEKLQEIRKIIKG